MNLKNRRYMKNEEFKARQFWLPFVDAAGIALQVMADIKEKTADWFKAWVKEFRSPRTIEKQEQLKLDFLAETTWPANVFWVSWTPKRNRQIFG